MYLIASHIHPFCSRGSVSGVLLLSLNSSVKKKKKQFTMYESARSPIPSVMMLLRATAALMGPAASACNPSALCTRLAGRMRRSIRSAAAMGNKGQKEKQKQTKKSRISILGNALRPQGEREAGGSEGDPPAGGGGDALHGHKRR